MKNTTPKTYNETVLELAENLRSMAMDESVPAARRLHDLVALKKAVDGIGTVLTEYVIEQFVSGLDEEQENDNETGTQDTDTPLPGSGDEEAQVRGDHAGSHGEG